MKIDLKEALLALEDRPDVSFKWDYGTGLVIAGSRSARGCACLAAYSALRAGIGKLFLASMEEVIAACASFVPEAMFVPCKSILDLTAKMDFSKLDVVGIGPGIGLGAEAEELVQEVIDICEAEKVPLILDADAIVLLKNSQFNFRGKVITPNLREFSQLSGAPVDDILANAQDYAEAYARDKSAWVVLKTHNTVVAAPDGRVYVNKTGNPGMATAGTGDVLLGMLMAMLCRFDDIFEACCAGVYLHGLAGDIAAGQKSRTALIARDIADYIGQAIVSLRED